MDIIRCFALLCVISAHFFLYTDFYYVLLTGSRLYLMTLILSASMICVPLFIMLSGYLLNKKQPVRSYYAKLGKTLSIYCLASVCCYVYGQYLAPYATGSGSAAELISRILSFRSPSYAVLFKNNLNSLVPWETVLDGINIWHKLVYSVNIHYTYFNLHELIKRSRILIYKTK